MDAREMFVSGIMVVAVIFLGGCAGKQFQSPIVFRSPVVSSSQDADTPAIAPEERASPTPKLAEAPPAPAPEPGQPHDGDTPRPNDIQILSSADLSGKTFSVLGRVTATSRAEQGFSRETAMENLKVEAFKHYGALAQGITDIEYGNKGSLFSSSGEQFDKVSGSVVSLTALAAPSSSQAPGALSLEAISIVSSEDLLNQSFRVLGDIHLSAQGKEGFSREQALASLKIEAFTRYGNQAKGLTDVKFRKGYEMFRYRKGQAMKPPAQPDMYSSASAEVVSW